MSKSLDQIHFKELLSPSISADPVMDSAAEGVDPEIKRVITDTSLVYIYSAIDTLPEAAIDLLAWQFHVDFYRPDLDLAGKRDLVKGSLEWHIKKGTGPPLQELIETVTTVEPEIREYPQFLTDWSLTDQDLIVEQPDNFRIDVIMDRDDSATAGVNRAEVLEMARKMAPKRSEQGTEVRFLGFKTDDPYSLTDLDLLGS